jgi:MFS family permease
MRIFEESKYADWDETVAGYIRSGTLTNGGAIIADMVKQDKRGFAMAIFTLGMLLGSVVGPVCGAF